MSEHYHVQNYLNSGATLDGFINNLLGIDDSPVSFTLISSNDELTSPIFYARLQSIGLKPCKHHTKN
jgi:hypothetical protein